MTQFQIPITPAEYATGLSNGAAVKGTGSEIPIFYPATGQQVGTLIEDGPQDVDRAVAAARRALAPVLARPPSALWAA